METDVPRTGITPLVLWYEDVLEDPDAAIKAVAHYLEVELDPSERLTVPKIRQQAQGDARERRTRHACGTAFK